MTNRNYSIDLLRGLAIIGMVLAAAIPWTSEFPGWMYHAQVGPPDFKFNPNNPGITWVDLVFPFFLFAMGAAFPLALRSKLQQGQYGLIIGGLFRRGALLVFFAIALAYLTPGNLTGANWLNYLTSLLTFFAFFLVFMRVELKAIWRYGCQVLGFLIIGLLTYYHSEVLGNTFNKANSNIIILVLANMAVFGSIFWLLTAESFLLRIAVLVAFMGIWFTKDIAGSWTGSLWYFHPDLHWFYNFSFLKYLCIVLPGSILGDTLLKFRDVASRVYSRAAERGLCLLAIMSFAFVAFHVITLYLRLLELNWIGHLLFGVAFAWFFAKKKQAQWQLYKVLVAWGFAFATLGLFFEPLDGGIKKDPSSFSYWFMTSGLAFVFYVVCDYLTKRFPNHILVSAVVKNGQNPMLAYCVSSFFIIPVLGLIQVSQVLDGWSQYSPYLGLVRTVIYVSLAVGITSYATDKKWFWRS